MDSPARPFTLELRTLGAHSYVYGSFGGAVTAAILVQYFAALKAMMEQHGCIRCLTDLSSNTMLGSVTEVPGLVDAFQRQGLSKRWKRALVMPPTDPKGQLWETIAVSRGHNIRLFPDLGAAERWLVGS